MPRYTATVTTGTRGDFSIDNQRQSIKRQSKTINQRQSIKDNHFFIDNQRQRQSQTINQRQSLKDKDNHKQSIKDNHLKTIYKKTIKDKDNHKQSKTIT